VPARLGTAAGLYAATLAVLYVYVKWYALVWNPGGQVQTNLVSRGDPAQIHIDVSHNRIRSPLDGYQTHLSAGDGIPAYNKFARGVGFGWTLPKEPWFAKSVRGVYSGSSISSSEVILCHAESAAFLRFAP
jgi:hypothetical protein